MKTKSIALFVMLLIASARGAGAADNVNEALQKGLLEEEANHNLDAAIQAYQTVLNQFDTRILQSAPSLEYNGPFDDFYALCPWEYDAFVYTSAYDGLPNVVLEAMSAGLVVIAPSLGGIPEAVTPESGFLVTADGEDEQLAEAAQ